MILEYITDLMAPWRRVSRVEFGLVVGLLSLPGLILMIVGFASTGSGMLGPLSQMNDVFGGNREAQMRPMTDADIVQSQKVGTALESMARGAIRDPNVPASAAPKGVDWPTLVNALALLLLTPFCRGRLNDMGYHGVMGLVVVGLIQISTLNDVVNSVLGLSLLPMATAFGMLNFAGYVWLTMAKPEPYTPIYERMAPPPSDGRLPTTFGDDR